MINAEEYRRKFCGTKKVVLEDGVEFEIKQISPLDLWDIAPGDKDNIAVFLKKVAIRGSVDPKITEDGKDGLGVKDLKLSHLNRLVDEILIFSGYKTPEGGQPDFLSQKPKG